MNLPTISLVTPSFNKGAFIESALRSILEQSYSGLDYGIMDGGSTDDTLAIIERYRNKLAFVVSEPDQGMYDALAKGFARSSGEIMGYLGADDLHMPWTLSVVGEIFATFPEIDWITSAYPLTADSRGRIVRSRKIGPFSRQAFFRGVNLPGFSWHSDGWIQQESTFWRRSLWERAGGLDRSLRLAGDFDLWCRFFNHAELVAVTTPLAAFRRHGEQISSMQAKAYQNEALAALLRQGGRPSGAVISRAFAFLANCRNRKSGATCSFDVTRNVWRIV